MSADHKEKQKVKDIKIAMYAPFLYYWMVNLSKEIARVANKTRLFTTGIYGNYPLNELEKHVHTVPRYKILDEYVAHPRLILDIVRWRPHLLILFATESPTSIMLYFMSQLLGTFVLLIVEENNENKHDQIFIELLAKIKRSVTKAIHKHAGIVVAESEASKEYLVAKGIRKARIHVIPHGTNIRYFHPQPKDPVFARSLGISIDKLEKTVILFVGELSEYKGAEYFVRSILNVSDNNDILFLIPSVGQVFDVYKSQLTAIRNVHIYPPLPNMDDMPKLYSLADIVVVPSKSYENGSSDRSPNSLIEAMACGKAIIGSHSGGIPTVIGDAGIIIPPNDSDAITHAILALAHDNNLIMRLGEKARNRAVKVLNNKAYASELINMYKETKM